MKKNESIILFDGVCNLCNSSVNFVIDRDKKRRFRFASLQSGRGRRLVREHGLPENELNSVVLVENERIYEKSSAALRISRSLSFPWPALYAFIIIPPFVRNFVYDIIARNRYKWFGKQDECRVPAPDLKALFLEDE